MTIILGYGSLLNVQSMHRTIPGKEADALRPVLVKGFRRLFNAISLKRKRQNPQSNPVTVLNVVEDSGEELGALAVPVDVDELAELDERERFYFKVRIPYFDFSTGEPLGEGLLYSFYGPEGLRQLLGDDVYEREVVPLGADGLFSKEVLPGADYLATCVRGGFSWGRAFGEHFLDHTFLGDGETSLRAHLSEEEVRAILEEQ